MSDKRICIVQVGKLGDTLICLPIAKHYNDYGYTVDWIVSENYTDIFDNISYVNVIKIPKSIGVLDGCLTYAYDYINNTKDKYVKVIDLSICFPKSKVNNFCNRGFLESFVHVKYHIAEVDISERYKLSITRNIEKENALYDLLVKNDEPYYLIHNISSEGKLFNYKKTDNVILFGVVEGYNTFDWYKIIMNAKAIYCCDSALCNFIDGMEDFKDVPKFYVHNSRKTPSEWDKTPIKNNWKILNGK